MPIPDAVISQHCVWKNHEIRGYAVAFVKTGLRLSRIGISFFGSDDVFSGDQPENGAIPGSAISMLRKAGLIKDFFGSNPELHIFGGRRMSKRKPANGRKINLYQIISVSLAEKFLERNQSEDEPQQETLRLF